MKKKSSKKKTSSKKSTGRTVSKKAGLRPNGTLKKGMRYAKGGRIVKAKGKR